MSASGAIDTTAKFFSTSSIASVMQAANKVPPVTYFVYLIAAGVGEISAGCVQQSLIDFGGALLADPRRTPFTPDFAPGSKLMKSRAAHAPRHVDIWGFSGFSSTLP